MLSGVVVRRVVRPLVWIGAAVPGLWVLVDALTDGLGANPVEAVTHRTGLTALTLLALALAVRPARDLLSLAALMPLRRTFGLAAYTYAVLHVLTYAVDQSYLSGLGLSPAAIVEDVRERPYVTMGFLAFVLLTPLAITSTSGWVKRMGAARWRQLHRLVYLAAPLAVVHFLWLVKADLLLPLAYAGVLAILLAHRIAAARVRRADSTKRDLPRASADPPPHARPVHRSHRDAHADYGGEW